MSSSPLSASGSAVGQRHDRESLMRRSWPYLVITLLTCIFNFPFFVPGMGNMHGGDFALFYLPFRIYSSIQVHAGSMPFRASEIFGGYPIWQDPQFSLLYPINLLFALVFPSFASEAVIDLYMLVNMLVLSWSAVFFLRRASLSGAAAVAGAALITFNGFNINHGQYLAFLQVESWSLVAGGIMITFFRGGAQNFKLPLLAAIALALGTLTGNPQPIVYFHYALGFGVLVLAAELWRKARSIYPALRMTVGGALMFGFGIALAVVHLLPTAYLIAMSPRAEITRAAAAWTPLEPITYLMMVFPGLYQILPWRLDWPPYHADITLSFTNLVEGYIPLGFFALALGLLGWWRGRRSVLVNATGVACILLLLCALGDQTPLYGIFYRFFPAVKLLRVSARVLLVFFPAWAVLAGLGVQALAADGSQVLKASRFIVGGILGTLLLIAIAVFKGQDNWLNAWISIWAEFARTYVLQNGSFFMDRYAPIMYGLKLQLVLAAVFAAAMILLFMVRPIAPRARVSAVMALMLAELFIYGFGWNMEINTPPLDKGIAREYLSFAKKPKGRSLGLHEYFRGPINSAMYMKEAPPIANGYSVTFDKWAGMFFPAERAPNSPIIQKTLCDLWNVTDIMYLRRPRWAMVGDRQMVVGDWGWTPLALPPREGEDADINVRDARMLKELTVNLETTRPVTELHVLVTAANVRELRNDSVAGRVALQTADGDWLGTRPLLIGRDLSDAGHTGPDQDPKDRPAHDIAKVAFRRFVPSDDTNNAAIYDLRLDVPTSAPLRAVNFQAAAPFPAILGVADVIAFFDDGTSITKEAFETAGFHKTESRNPAFYTLGRSTATGYIHLAPTAVGSSYKKMEYPFIRATNGEIDPLKTVVVDKRVLDDAALKKLNAPNPQTFAGEAQITWHDDEHATLHTQTNQRGWVFLSYAWDAGWTATVNGRPSEIYRGTGAFMTIPVPEGTAVIEMNYRPRGLVAGMIISLLSLLTLGLAWRLSPWLTRKLHGEYPPAK